MQKLTIPNYTLEELESLLNNNPDYVIGSRLLALIQIKKGMSSRKLEELYYKSHSRFCTWVNNFNKDGIEGLKNKHRSGRKPKLDQFQKNELKNVLQNNRPSDFDFNTALWNGPIVIEFIKSRYGVEYKKAQIYNLLKELGFTFQKARGKYPEANSDLREEFISSLKKTN
jgi:transposase